VLVARRGNHCLRSCAAALLCLSGLGLQCALNFVSRRIAVSAAYFVAAFYSSQLDGVNFDFFEIQKRLSEDNLG
jgi:hypothetical protein